MSIFTEGAKRPGNIFASKVAAVEEQQPVIEQEQTETAFFESVSEDQMFEAIEKVAVANLRADGAAAVCAWIEDGDSDFDALDSFCFGLAGSGDDDDELSETEAEDYNDILKAAAEFIVNVCGCDSDTVTKSFAGDDDASATIFDQVETFIEGKSTSDLIANFSVRENMMMEALKKVIRNGEVKMIRTNRRKKRMTAAQKAALKKARRKAHSAAGKAARKKSLRLRKSRGMK
ncbi:hypothetical protein ACN08P_23135 (plasmid) [Photobacterium leiognathi subsp. mandapamensis]|uniref:hypothetical protein n=1 Tax=Photobacterium leiognathi TaxID=553611 RepID=UPI003AF35FE2